MKISDTFIHKMGPKLIDPFNPKHVNPASYDVTLADEGIFRGKSVQLPFVLQPGDFILVSSKEYWRFPCDVAGQLLLKSTMGRNAINHMLAGWFDPDFFGHATMELKNDGHEPFELKPGARVAQMVFDWVFPPAYSPYRVNGRYHGQKNVTAAREAVDEKKASVSLDTTSMWVAGPYDERHIKTYLEWVDHIKKLLVDRPELGTVESPFKNRMTVAQPIETEGFGASI